ncbi:MAG: tRNA dihydrouridine synthase DusB [Pseudomonadota bacterium]
MKIGPYELANQVIAAPMAGVTDKPYRRLCRQFGAGMTVSEMVTSRVDLHKSTKSRFRMDLDGEPEPVVVQIVGTDPQMLAEAARHNVANGAQIIDINMGCPAKKVCKKAAGSALLADEPLVANILSTVVEAVPVPVTVKIRTGTTPEERNAVTIGKIAEDAGIQSLTIHGRTRQCKFVGAVEYDTIARVKQSISIPVVANGDIDSPVQAAKVLKHTGADAIMIGRAAQGQPWLFQQISDYLQYGTVSPIPEQALRATTIMQHLTAIHDFYGERLGVKFARKHIKWYLQHWESEIDPQLRTLITTSEEAQQQLALIEEFLLGSLQNADTAEWAGATARLAA